MHSLSQINHIRWKGVGLLVLKAAIVIGCAVYLFKKMENVDWFQLLALIGETRILVVLGFVLLLTPLNWYLEAEKWRICLKPVVNLASSAALNSVLRGLSLNWVLPFTIGDFIGRILGLPKTRQTVLAMILNRYVSLSMTGAAGISGAAYYYGLELLAVWPLPISFCVFLLLQKKFFSPYTHRHLILLWLITALRYGVFTFQFVLLLQSLLPDIGFGVCLVGVPIVFLLRSLVPSVLGAIGVREVAVIFVFGQFTAHPELLTMASILIWLTNIVLPSVFGLVPVVAYKTRVSL